MAKIIVNNPRQVINGGAKKYYFKVKGLGGPKGDKGDTGATGQQGPQGPQGNAATVSVGSTTTLPVGQDATVQNVGTLYNAVLNFGIPQGPRGPQGATGAKGDKGDKGDQGNPGPQGEKGTNATVTVGTTTTTEPGTQAYAWNSSSNPNNAVINFNIPRGATGATGATGPQGPTGPTGPAGADGADGQDGQNFTPTIVETLPTTGDQSKLYLTPKAHTTSTATGNPIEATITEQAGQMESFQLDGDTFQQTYTGKNLLNVEGKWSITAGAGVTVTDGADGSLILNGTVTAREDIRLYSSSDRFTLESGKTVTMSREPYSNWNLIWHRFTSESGTGTSDIKYFDPGASSFTYTTLDTDYGYQFIMRLPVGTTFNNTHVYLQLEKSSTATSFEPYVGGQASPNPDYPQAIQTVTGEQTVTINSTNYPISLGSIKLCKLGSYQDYIWKDGESWKVHKAIKKLQMADTTAWVKRADGQFYSENWAEINEVNDETGFCSHFIYSTTVWYGVGYYGISSAGNLWLITGDTTLTSITLFETWLNTKKPIAYQPLATPTDTTITDTTLIAQLEAIRTASLENGTNTITNTATGTNLAGDMEIGYYGFNPTNRYDKFIWLDLNNNYEQIGGE